MQYKSSAETWVGFSLSHQSRLKMKTILFLIAFIFVLGAVAGSEAEDLSEEKLYNYIKGMILLLNYFEIYCNKFHF